MFFKDILLFEKIFLMFFNDFNLLILIEFEPIMSRVSF
jgi:hypothetical protein